MYFWSHYALVYVGSGYLFQKTTEINLKSLPHGAADRLVRAGLSAQQAGNTDDALLDYRAAIRINPRNVFAHYNTGVINQRMGNAAGAESEYKETVAIDPRWSSALYNMGVLLTASRPAEAISYYRRDLRVDPRNAAAHLNLGLLLIRHGSVKQGRAHLREAIRMNPTFRRHLPADIKP